MSARLCPALGRVLSKAQCANRLMAVSENWEDHIHCDRTCPHYVNFRSPYEAPASYRGCVACYAGGTVREALSGHELCLWHTTGGAR